MDVSVVGVLLSGGESRRFGQPKALVSYKSHYFFEYSLTALEPVVDRIVIISHPQLKKRFEQLSTVDVFEDLAKYQGQGPLAGILTAMEKILATWFVVAPCDTPNLTTEDYRALMNFMEEGVDAVVPVQDGRIQPLIAIYHVRIKDKVKALLESNDLRLRSLFSRINVKYVNSTEIGISEKAFLNVNTVDELKKLDVND
ncbi:molybdenum cofactor guanylyltransferase [Bacillus timonensis]|nr:molybdenum cofactor guanylyltransferase [Bacillus timonensis]